MNNVAIHFVRKNIFLIVGVINLIIGVVIRLYLSKILPVSGLIEFGLVWTFPIFCILHIVRVDKLNAQKNAPPSPT
ncbi:hypothetical protein [Acinetobacter sp. P1(2025)]|uniref:hypothetical protein n=1 Tax=Acinetobacter sp. P1(2025) TaxID=3446120 RepID=UPI003F53BE98